MTYDRKKLEKIEDQTLAPYGVRSKDTQGREHPDKEPQHRTSFQRDRDRILHTTAFRRLKYKTQVFINYEGDYFRTRLTHTLEVAQIGRTLARALGVNEDLVEAICLAHDLGHAPFGHSAEVVLNRLMKDHGGFDHNKQSFRVVTQLTNRYADFPGLNLTWEIREGIVKHETEYDVSDAKDFNPNLRGTIEAQIANIADELAYTTSDLDDGLRAGMITPEQLSGIEIWEILVKSLGWEQSTLTKLDRHAFIRRMVGLMVGDAVESTAKRIDDAKVKSVQDVQELDYNLIGFSEDMVRRHREIKDFLYNNLYRHHRVVRMAVKAERIIVDLFNAYRDQPDMLEDHYKPIIEERGLERTVCDYLAGMTDRYAIDEYQKLFDPLTLP